MAFPDSKTSIQARCRCRPTLPPESHELIRVEHEYAQPGALTYLAAIDVHHAKVRGRCEGSSGFVPSSRLVEHMVTRPYASSRRVFFVAGNGSSRRGRASIEREAKTWPAANLVQLSIHAPRLNQIGIAFSIVEPKALAPTYFRSLDVVADRLIAVEHYLQDTGTRSIGSSPAPISTSCPSASPPTSPLRPQPEVIRQGRSVPERN